MNLLIHAWIWYYNFVAWISVLNHSPHHAWICKRHVNTTNILNTQHLFEIKTGSVIPNTTPSLLKYIDINMIINILVLIFSKSWTDALNSKFHQRCGATNTYISLIFYNWIKSFLFTNFSQMKHERGLSFHVIGYTIINVKSIENWDRGQ